MDVDRILQTMNDHEVAYLLIGGMNFLLRHQPVLTFDVDLWIEDHELNRRRCEEALGSLAAEWGASDEDWEPTRRRPAGWLDHQPLFCLTSPHGAIDIFREVTGLPDWSACRRRALPEQTAAETRYWGLSDQDMLLCQLALDESQRKAQRVLTLEQALRARGMNHGAG